MYVITVHTAGAVEGEGDAAHNLIMSKPYNVTFIIRIDGSSVSTVTQRIQCKNDNFSFFQNC